MLRPYYYKTGAFGLRATNLPLPSATTQTVPNQRASQVLGKQAISLPLVAAERAAV